MRSPSYCPRAFAIVLAAALASPTRADNQTADLTPVDLGAGVPYRIELREYPFGTAPLPTLHSFAAGVHDGKWILIAGRTNGLHGFENNPAANFPPQYQNRDVWLIDPASRQSWHRSLDDPSSGLSEAVIRSLTPTNNQFYQRGERLYMTGGYGQMPVAGFGTYDVLTAVDLPALADWVIDGTGSAAGAIRQISDPLFRVTGGAMLELDGRTHLVFGHDFQGGYVPGKTGVYTNQVRSFDIVDDGATLSIANPSSTDPLPEYRRRDLNVAPVVRPGEGGSRRYELVALSGVFTPTVGAWTVPVEIDAAGQPSMADPALPGTFKQGMNNYHSAKLGLYSEAAGAMHLVLFGGISLQYVDPATGLLATDNEFPFINEITSVVVDAAGNYSQHLLGEFPELYDQDGNRLRFGSGAEFFPAHGLPTYQNGVLALDQLTGRTTLGYIFGGIVSNAPHTRGVEGALTAGSNLLFEVVLIPVPQPATLALGTLGAPLLFPPRRRARRHT